jgi:hypothetical protein
MIATTTEGQTGSLFSGQPVGTLSATSLPNVPGTVASQSDHAVSFQVPWGGERGTSISNARNEDGALLSARRPAPPVSSVALLNVRELRVGGRFRSDNRPASGSWKIRYWTKHYGDHLRLSSFADVGEKSMVGLPTGVGRCHLPQQSMLADVKSKLTHR